MRKILKERIGERLFQKCGYMATIIDYRKSDDIDVQMNDANITIVRNVTYQNFRNGLIGTISSGNDKLITEHPPVGTIVKMADGHVAELMFYYQDNPNVIAVRFDCHFWSLYRSLAKFCNGTLKFPKN